MSKELYAKLVAPFPPEAYSSDKSRGFALTTVKAQYIKERLNDVFGIFGWKFQENFVDKEKGVVCHGILLVQVGDETRIVNATGGCDYKDKGQTIGDPYKSAATDSLSKACSFIGIANEVFKGNVKPNGKSSPATSGKPEGKFNVALAAINRAETSEDLNTYKQLVSEKSWQDGEEKKLVAAVEARIRTLGGK